MNDIRTLYATNPEQAAKQLNELQSAEAARLNGILTPTNDCSGNN